MNTVPVFSFVVREDFGNFKKGDKFVASVTSKVSNLVEIANFVLEGGEEIKNVPWSCVKFKD